LVLSLVVTISHYWLQGVVVFLLLCVASYEWDRWQLKRRIRVLEAAAEKESESPGQSGEPPVQRHVHEWAKSLRNPWGRPPGL
jgi:hypothetical protein